MPRPKKIKRGRPHKIEIEEKKVEIKKPETCPIEKSIEEKELEILERIRSEMTARNLTNLEEIARTIEIYKKQIIK